MCTIRLKELTVAWQNSKKSRECHITSRSPFQTLRGSLNQYHANCMHFSKMHLVSYCYTVVLYELISKLYISKYSAVYLSDARVTVLFCKLQKLRNPTIQITNVCLHNGRACDAWCQYSLVAPVQNYFFSHCTLNKVIIRRHRQVKH